MSEDPQGGTRVERYIGRRDGYGRFDAGMTWSARVEDAVPILPSVICSLVQLVLITRTTTPGTPTLEAVPLREGDVLQGPYVVQLVGGFYRNTDSTPGPLAGAFKYEYIENAISVAGSKGGIVCRLLSHPGEPVVTHTVVPLTEAVLALLGSPPSGASGS